MLSRFHLVPERNGQTDGRTDRFAISISRVSMLTRDKNREILRSLIITQYQGVTDKETDRHAARS